MHENRSGLETAQNWEGLVRKGLEMNQATVSVHSGDRNEMAELKNVWV